MPLYRTVSDRGLWKKYKKNETPQPQHFHKPAYIDREKPVVTYSQLDLGDGYRANSRQSIPDVRREIEDANSRFDAAYNKDFKERRSRFTKSCPTTPGTTTPVRSLSRARIYTEPSTARDQDVGGEYQREKQDDLYNLTTINTINNTAPPHPHLVNGTGQYYPDDDRYSFESRSLTAYSNYSERDSVLNDNAKYPGEPLDIYSTLERVNPFQCERAYQRDVENVVQLFLQRSVFPQLSILNTNTANNLNNNNLTQAECVSGGQRLPTRVPGKIENLQSPGISSSELGNEPPQATSSPLLLPATRRFSSREAIKQLRKEFLAEEPGQPRLNKPKANRYLRSENRWQSSGGSASVESTSCSPTNSSSIVTDTPPPHPPASSSGTTESSSMAQSPDPHFMSDTVKQEELPRVHHAEVVSLRKEETTTSMSESGSSSSDEEDDVSVNSRNIMINIKPVPVQDTDGSSDSNTEAITPRLEAPPQKQNIWGANRQKAPPLPATSPPKNYELPAQSEEEVIVAYHCNDEVDYQEQKYFPDTDFSLEESRMYRGGRPEGEEGGQAVESSPPMPQLIQHPQGDQDEPVEREANFAPVAERNFQDTAFTTFHQSNQASAASEAKPKKKGIFSGLFKKSGKKSNPYGDDFIQIEPKLDIDQSESEIDDSTPDLHGDQSPRFHILPQPKNEQRVHPPSSANKELFRDHEEVAIGHQGQDPNTVYRHQQADQRNLQMTQFFQSETVHYAGDSDTVADIGETDIDAAYIERQGRPLERKLSMSKPTNLDDLLAEDEQQEPRQPVEKPVVIPNVELQVDQVDTKPAERFFPEHERTQEIDIDAILFGLDATPEETEEEIERENGNMSLNSNEVDVVTRYNTALNSGIITTTTVSSDYYNRNGETTYSTATGNDKYYSAHDKVITVNGETTFSASPPSPGYIQANFAEGLRESEMARTSSRNDIINSTDYYSMPDKTNDDYNRELEKIAQQEKALYEEQKQLEKERQRLADENNALQVRLEAQELERRATDDRERLEGQRKKKPEVVFSEKKQVFTQRFDSIPAEEKKSKPKSIFNFDGLKKKKKKNKQVITEGYDSAYEDLTDNDGQERTKKKNLGNYRRGPPRPGTMQPRETPEPGQEQESNPDLTTADQDPEPSEAKTETPTVNKKGGPRGFTKFLVKKETEPEAEPEPPVDVTVNGDDNNSVIIHDTSLPPITPPQEFRQNNLAENIVSELKKSTSQMNKVQRKSSSTEVESAEDSFSRGRNRFSMRKIKKTATEEANDKAPTPSQNKSLEPIEPLDNSFLKGKNRFSMKKIKKSAPAEADLSATEKPGKERMSAQSEAESGDDSLSRVKSRFSLRKPKNKIQKSKSEIADLNTSLTGDDQPASSKEGLSEGDEPVEQNKRPPHPVEQTRPESGDKKSSGFAGIFGMRSSKRAKSAERPNKPVSHPGRPTVPTSTSSSSNMRSGRPRSATDLSRTSRPPVAQKPTKGSMANYFGVPLTDAEQSTNSPNPTLDSNSMRKSQSDYVIAPGQEVPDGTEAEVTVGLITQSKSLLGVADHGPSGKISPGPDSKTYSQVDSSAAQNAKRVAEEMKSRLQGREGTNQTPSVDGKPPPSANGKLRKNVIERPVTSPPEIPVAKTNGNDSSPPPTNTGEVDYMPVKPRPNSESDMIEATKIDQRPAQPVPAHQNRPKSLNTSQGPPERRPPTGSQGRTTPLGGGDPSAIQRGRQTGRQSGRFRRGGGPANASFNSAGNMSLSSQLDSSSRLMDTSFVSTPEVEDVPVEGGPKLSRTDSYRRARPDHAREGIKSARSEESVRDVVKARKGAAKKKPGECSVM